METETIRQLPDRFVPRTGEEYASFLVKSAKFNLGNAAEKPYAAHWEEPAKETKAAAPKAERPPPKSDEAADQKWYKHIIPIPPKGMKRDEYLKHPQTIGQLYEARHGSDDESNAMRQRLWGFLMHFEPKPYKGQVSDSDTKFRFALDEFGEWFKEHHPGEDL